MSSISDQIPDWSRETFDTFWSPAKKLLRAIRDYQMYAAKKGLLNQTLKKLTVLRYRFWSVIAGADIPLNSQIGGGVLMPHPNGIVIHSAAKIGPNCLIHQQVTISVNSNSSGAPVISGHVDIGAGAKIIGHNSIGKHVKIGANAVVIKDVPDFAIVAGVPAKIVGSTNEWTANAE